MLDQIEAGLRAELGGRYESKVQRLGWTKGRAKEARILGRTIILDEYGLTIEADPALLEDAARTLDLTSANPVITPVVKPSHFGAVAQEEVQRRRLQGAVNGPDRGRL